MRKIKCILTLALAVLLPAAAQSLVTAASTPFLGPEAPAPPSHGPKYYTLTGTNVESKDSRIISQLNGQQMLPYANDFWFNLPQNYRCMAPQPNTSDARCHTGAYRPLYTIDHEFQLVSRRFPDIQRGEVVLRHCKPNHRPQP